MTLETLFYVCNAAVIPFWAALIFAPRWKGTDAMVRTQLGPSLLALVYVCMAFAFIPGSEGNMGSLADLKDAFADGGVLLLGWVHYLCFDLFVVAWIFSDARQRGVSHILVAPCLALTLMLGPSGWLAYLLTRRFAQHRALKRSAVG